MPDVYGESSPKPTPMVGESGTVAAVEPNPPTIARLERNIQLNHAANIVVRKVACAKT
jgi:FkbM family methyltransferase